MTQPDTSAVGHQPAPSEDVVEELKSLRYCFQMNSRAAAALDKAIAVMQEYGSGSLDAGAGGGCPAVKTEIESEKI